MGTSGGHVRDSRVRMLGRCKLARQGNATRRELETQRSGVERKQALVEGG